MSSFKKEDVYYSYRLADDLLAVLGIPKMIDEYVRLRGSISEETVEELRAMETQVRAPFIEYLQGNIPVDVMSDMLLVFGRTGYGQRTMACLSKVVPILSIAESTCETLMNMARDTTTDR